MNSISLMNSKDKIDEEEARELFNRYDTQHKGSLSKEEFEKMILDTLKNLSEETPEENFQTIAQEGMKYFDKNKNGKIEFNEFYMLLDFLILEKGFEIQ